MCRIVSPSRPYGTHRAAGVKLVRSRSAHAARLSTVAETHFDEWMRVVTGRCGRGLRATVARCRHSVPGRTGAVWTKRSSSGSAPGASPYRCYFRAFPCTASSCRRQWSQNSNDSHSVQHRRDHRRLRDHEPELDVPRRLPPAQHDHEPHHPSRTGPVLRQRRTAPGTRRLVRHRAPAFGGGVLSRDPEASIPPSR